MWGTLPGRPRCQTSPDVVSDIVLPELRSLSWLAGLPASAKLGSHSNTLQHYYNTPFDVCRLKLGSESLKVANNHR